MNPIESNGPPLSLYKSIRFDDFDVTWAGPNPLGPGFCFGSDDGRLRFTDEEGNVVGEPFPPVRSREAINGVAYSDECLAVSTRAEITLFSFGDGRAKPDETGTVPVGAHNIIATTSGYFVAVCGREGFITIRPHSDEHEVRISGGAAGAPYLYKAAFLQDALGAETLVFAARQHGVAVIPFSPQAPGGNLSVASFANTDIVDVCAIPRDAKSNAVAAVGQNGTLILFRDALTDKDPLAMKFDSFQGTVYRVLSCRGHVFVVTSKVVYMLMDMTSRFEQSVPDPDGKMKILTMPEEVVDASICGNKFLLVVTASDVLRFDIGLMERIQADDKHGGSLSAAPKILRLPRESHGIPQETRALAGVA